MFNRSDFLRYQQQHHPTSLQSLVSSSAAGAGGGSGGVSNPGLHGPPSGRQSRQEEPVTAIPVFAAADRDESRSHHQSSSRISHRHRSSSRHRGSSRGRSRSTQRRVRWALLTAFALVLLGVVVTSAYAIDRRLAQIPQLLYAGLGLCSIGLCLIVVSVSILVSRQLQSKDCLQMQPPQPHQHQQQQQQQLLHRTSSAPVAVSELQTAAAASQVPRRCRRQQNSEVPIWYIGCHRDTARPYCPPVPPSYWDTTAATAAAATASTTSVPFASASVNAAPKPPTSSRQLAPLPPPPPPSYQEALRCLEDQGSLQQPHRQHTPGTFDQMSVLKWTVQSAANFAAASHHRPAQQPSFQLYRGGGMGSQLREADSRPCFRRSESSSFIGEPILV